MVAMLCINVGINVLLLYNTHVHIALGLVIILLCDFVFQPSRERKDMRYIMRSQIGSGNEKEIEIATGIGRGTETERGRGMKDGTETEGSQGEMT